MAANGKGSSPPALDKIEVALAALVPEIGPFAAHEYGRRAGGDLHQRVERMRHLGHVELSLLAFAGNGGLKCKKAAPFGCGLLENLADLAIQRRRRTWRTRASSGV